MLCYTKNAIGCAYRQDVIMMTEEEKRIYTIDDIARELGVSKTTVSRAISGK